MAESPSKRAKANSSSAQHICDNFINGQYKPSKSAQYLPIESPLTGETIGKVAISNKSDVQHAIDIAKSAFPPWSGMTVKSRATVMLKLYGIMMQHADELVDIVVLENGKNKAEALASVMKGIETLEYACGLPQLIQGKTLTVSRGITCTESKDPLGIIASIVPFNFPLMVPFWTVPIALTTGNCVILKPSEKVPITMTKVASYFKQAGVPDGVFQIVHGQVEAVNSLCDNPAISAVTFVGSSKVAQIVSRRCRALDKRVLALGGAKNHLIALPDADIETAAKDIVASYAGCAGQRCMAASVLLAVGNCEALITSIVEKSKKLTRGTQAGQVGAIIDAFSHRRILKYINEAEEGDDVTILVDGRKWSQEKKGYWVGPTILLHENSTHNALSDEIFGPVLSIHKVKSFEEALAIENKNQYGNAASVYTTNGNHAEYFTSKFRAGMIGVNIGIPVPREPFSFGGLYGTASKYGDMDITGDGCIEFCTNRRKVTSKWSATQNNINDKANFSGQM